MKKRGFEKVSFSQWKEAVYSKDWFEDEERNVYENFVTLPKRKTFMSAGYDIFTPIGFILRPNQEILIPLGWKVFMQPNEFLIIIPRSGLGFTFYSRLANTIGIIDSDYYNNSKNEGHVFVKMRNEGGDVMHIEKGKAIAQGIFLNYLLVDGDDYSTGQQRNGGLGSTE